MLCRLLRVRRRLLLNTSYASQHLPPPSPFAQSEQLARRKRGLRRLIVCRHLILEHILQTVQEQANLALDSAKTSKMRWNGYGIPVPFPLRCVNLQAILSGREDDTTRSHFIAIFRSP